MHSYILRSSPSSSSVSNSFFSMNDLDTNMDLNPDHLNLIDPLATPAPSPGPQQNGAVLVVNISLGIWNDLLTRLSSLKALLEIRSSDHERALETHDNDIKTLKMWHNTLEREFYDQTVLPHKVSHQQEAKIPDPPIFSGDRKDLLSFLTKCQIKFYGQPSRFLDERSKILYMGSRLEGPTYSWFQPLIATASDTTKPAPPPNSHCSRLSLTPSPSFTEIPTWTLPQYRKFAVSTKLASQRNMQRGLN